MSEVLNNMSARSDVVKAELWYYDTQRFEKSITYQEIDGESPYITNHLSLTTFDIMAGAGTFYTDGMIADVQVGDRISVLPRHRYAYDGLLAMLITHKQAQHPDYVTYGDQELGNEQRRVLRRIDRHLREQMVMDELMQRVMPGVLSIESAIAYMGSFASDEDFARSK